MTAESYERIICRQRDEIQRLKCELKRERDDNDELRKWWDKERRERRLLQREAVGL